MTYAPAPTLPLVVAPTPTLATRQSDRVLRAILRERKDGLLLALRLRVIVLALVAAYLLSLGWTPDQWINLGSLAAMSLVAWLQFRVAGSRVDYPAVMAPFPVADALLVAFAVFGHMGLEPQIPWAIMEEERPFSWFVLLLALQALAYRPWLAVWAGIVIAAVWLAVLAGLLSVAGAHATLPMIDANAPDAVRRFLAAYYDPTFVNAEIWVREALIAVLAGAILAVAVYRAQAMLARAVGAERSRANLARYFSPTMVDELAGNDRPFQSARKQEIGVLFADIVGFTRLAEHSPPDVLIALLREFHGRVAAVIFRHGGTLDKFIGDCAMATFGTPHPGIRDATRTVACAIDIAAAIAEWNGERRAAGLAPIAIGVGAHFGPVVLGDIGDERRLEFAVLGDTVNVASRLEGLTRPLARTVLLSDDLVRAANREGAAAAAPLLASFTRIAPQRLRNRDEEVEVWGFGGMPAAAV